MIEDDFGKYLVLIPHCMTEILAKECKSGISTVLALGTVGLSFRTFTVCATRMVVKNCGVKMFIYIKNYVFNYWLSMVII